MRSPARSSSAPSRRKTDARAGTALARSLPRPVLVRLGGVAVPSYPAMLYVGCVGGILVGAEVARASGLDEWRFAIASVVLLVPSFVGSRLLYVATHLDAYRSEPGRIWRRSEGGSSLYGGLVLSILASVPLVAALGLPFWTYWDAAAITMLVGLIFTRVGCQLHGCCAGHATSGRLGVWLPDGGGHMLRRFPSQMLEAGWGVVMLVAALILRAELPSGTLFAGVVAAYLAGRIVLEPTREAARTEGSLRRNLMLFGVLLALACCAAAWRAGAS